MAKFILVGMSGSGKTTIGKRASKATFLKFIDLDEVIENKYGTISGIFEKYGEKKFRDIESIEFKYALNEDNVLISTGGGILGRDYNRELVTEGIVVFIDRTLENILKTMDDSNRPMVKNKPGMIEKLFNERYQSYLDSMDYRITNNGSEDECVVKLIDIIKGI